MGPKSLVTTLPIAATGVGTGQAGGKWGLRSHRFRRRRQYRPGLMKVMGRAADGDAAAVPPSPAGSRAPWTQRARSLVLGPHGGGTTRRRASDALRVGTAAALVVICIPLAQAN